MKEKATKFEALQAKYLNLEEVKQLFEPRDILK